MSAKPTQPPVSPEDEFLARLGQAAPISPDIEQAHLAAAVNAVREAGAGPLTSGRSARRSPRLWRTPRMALSNALAALAALSLPAKAAAATTVAAVAIGGGVAATSAPETPPTDTPASEALLEAEENTGFPLPARGEPSRDEDVDTTVEAQDEHENNGLNEEVLAEDPKDRSDVGKARAAENQAAAEARAAEARANADQAEERRQEAEDAAAEQRRDAEARQEAQSRRQQADDTATTSDTEADLSDDEDDDAADDDDAAGADASGAGRAKADAARGR